MQPVFDHERLDVYQASLKFIVWAADVVDLLPHSIGAVEQIDRASTSVPLNIAEGNGKSSYRDRARFLEVAKGSALECAACLDVLAANGRLAFEVANAGKQLLVPVVRMLAGLIAHCHNHLAEDPAAYRISATAEQEQEQE